MGNPRQNWSLDEWLLYLEQQHPTAIDMGLERIRQVADALCISRPATTVIMVGGTNGKGSTVRYMESILLADKRRVATYTSPHFLRYTERVRIDGQELTESDHCAAFAAVEAARGDISLTYFEAGTLAALWLIARSGVEVALLEVGLGGRLDAVNLIDADIAVVTSVGIDHCDYLGPERESIGFEKAGIFRPEKPAICADLNPPKRLIEHAEQIKSRLYLAGRDYKQAWQSDSGEWSYRCNDWLLENLPPTQLPWVNAATALTALSFLAQRPSGQAVRQGLASATLVGRLQVFQSSPLVVLDVAHNPQAAEYLAEQITSRWAGRRVRAVCAMLKDKDIESTLAALRSSVDYWYFAPSAGSRGTPAERLQQALPAASSQCFGSIKDAYQCALKDAEEGDLVLCFGSFVTIQAIYELEG